MLRHAALYKHTDMNTQHDFSPSTASACSLSLSLCIKCIMVTGNMSKHVPALSAGIPDHPSACGSRSTFSPTLISLQVNSINAGS